VNNSKETAYLKTLIDREARLINTKLGADEETDRKRLVAALSELSARVAVLEAVALQQGINVPISNTEVSRASEKLPLEQSISIASFEANDAIQELVVREDGRPFAIISSGSELNVLLEVSRQIDQTLAIDIMGKSRGVSLRKVKLYLDTQLVQYRISSVRGQKRLIAALPKAKFVGATHLLIKFPKIPRSEYLRLGDIHCVPRLGLFKGLFKRLMGR
jgi:hypothetical protein